MTKLGELSVFFPAYNEERNIRATVEKAFKILPKVANQWEIVVIDDGSKDKTGLIVKEIIKSHPQVSLITHTPNRGYGAALKSGLYNAKYDWICFTDADGQFDFAEIGKLIDKQQQTHSDLVIGYYLKRQVPIYRIMGSKIWELAVWILFGLKVHDIDCGFKLVSKAVVNKIPRLESERGPFITSELLIKAKTAGFKLAQVGVHHYPRMAGQATGSDPKVIISGLKDLWQLRKKLK